MGVPIHVAILKVVAFPLLKVILMFTAPFITGVELKVGLAYKTGLLPDEESN
jgi:hypothetical protein